MVSLGLKRSSKEAFWFQMLLHYIAFMGVVAFDLKVKSVMEVEKL